MPKMKSNRAARKRFKLTGTGGVKRAQSGLRHGMIGKSRGWFVWKKWNPRASSRFQSCS